jgi:cytochrome c peroxidase
MRKLLFFLITVMVACKPDPAFILGDGHNHTHFNPDVPAGLPVMPIPADNPLTVEGVALGRKLFYDNRLSANNTQSCGSCHKLNHYFVDSANRYSVGITGAVGTRNSMPLFNLGYAKRFMWDGSANSLEEQALLPIVNPIEMNESIANVIAKLQQDTTYVRMFREAFGSQGITSLRMAQALAQFERTIVSGVSKFDLWRQGKVELNPQELRGHQVYIGETKGDCFHCHSYGSTFTDFDFRNTGLDSIPLDKGLGKISGLASDDGKFKTPTLRNIAQTAPYMHDGRFETLRECIEHYNVGFKYTKNLAPELKTVVKNRMTEQDIDDLIAFLNTLTDTAFVNKTQWGKP